MNETGIEKTRIEKTEIEKTEIERKEMEGTEAEKKELSSFELSRFKQFISDWSSKEAGGRKMNELLQLGDFPLSWYYRPILYSSLLPAPFVTAKDFLEGREANKSKIKLYSFAFRKSLLLRDFFHRKISLLKEKKEKKEEEEKEEKKEKMAEENKEKNALKGKILFLTFTNYIQNNSPPFREVKIMKKIKEDGKYEVLMLVADPLSSFSPKKIRQLSHKQLFHTLYDYYTQEINEKAGEEAGKLAKKWQEINWEEKKKMLSFEGRDAFRYYQPNLDFLYSEDFLFTVARLYHTYHSLLKKEKIKAVVLSSQNNIFEKTLIAAAKNQESKIPVFVLQHGIALGDTRTVDTPENVKFEVFGDEFKRKLIHLGAEANNVEVAGPIIFDGIEKFKEKKKIKGRKILFTTSPMIEDRFMDSFTYFLRVKKILLDFQKLKPEKIVIGLHPREKKRKAYEKLVKEINLPALISTCVKREILYSFIQECDLAANFGSTVALEAMIIGRPTLSIDIFDQDNPTNKVVINSGATNFVKYGQDLAKIAEKLLHHNNKEEKAKEFIRKTCYKIDGKASERIVENIYHSILHSTFAPAN